jgi:hypothetical protein
MQLPVRAAAAEFVAVAAQMHTGACWLLSGASTGELPGAVWTPVRTFEVQPLCGSGGRIWRCPVQRSAVSSSVNTCEGFRLQQNGNIADLHSMFCHVELALDSCMLHGRYLWEGLHTLLVAHLPSAKFAEEILVLDIIIP